MIRYLFTVSGFLLSKSGRYKTEVKVHSNELPGEIHVMISNDRIDSQNSFHYFKTTNRKLYESGQKYCKENRLFDLIYLNERGELTEGSITNLFLKIKGKWYTPPVSAGILNGVYRGLFIREKMVFQKTLFPDDLDNAEDIILTNALRGAIKVIKLRN